MPAELIVRRATTRDVGAIRELVDQYAGKVLLVKETVTLYEDVQEFWVAVDGERVVGCGALHILWEDLGEIRTLAVQKERRGTGLGGILLELLVDRARALGISRLFCLTFEVEFFTRRGFEEIGEQVVDPDVYSQLIRSPDEGVAEFLDLAHVKPNTLGNTRMLKAL